MAWPDNTPAIPNANFTDDADTVTGGTGARFDLLNLIAKLNQALDSMPAGSVPVTDQNDGGYMKAVTPVNVNEICILDAQGHPLTSNKTHVTALGTTDATVPTSKAVKDAIDAAIAALPTSIKIFAYGKITAGGTVTGVNVSGGFGGSRVNFVVPLADALKASVVAVVQDSASTNHYVTLSGINVGDFRFTVRNASGSSTTDHDFVYFQVFEWA